MKTSLLIALLVALLFSPNVKAQVPTISSFSPTSGAVGTTVTITGKNFSSTPANNIVYFGGVKASVTNASSTSLAVTVPVGAAYKPISVTTNKLTAYSTLSFTLTFSSSLNISGGTFSFVGDSTIKEAPTGIVLDDFNGDGKIDIAATGGSSSGNYVVSILSNTGSPGIISFSPHTEFPTGDMPENISDADLDGDGKIDLITPNINNGNDTGTLSILKNTSVSGNISFAQPLTLLTGTSPYNAAINDLNGDGKPDIVVTNFFSNTISVFINTSTGNNISFNNKIDYTTGLAPQHVAISDIDGDGKPDIIVTDFGAGTISIFKNSSAGGNVSFAPRVDFTSGTNNPFDIKTGDIDGDGKPDIIITNNNYTSVNQATVAFSIIRNTSTPGSISFATRLDYFSGNGENISLGDLNGDGKPEIIISTPIGFDIEVNGSTPGNISFSSVYAGSYNFIGISNGDLDGDGLPDLAGIQSIGRSVKLMKNIINSPVVNSFSPTSAKMGDTVTITGTNFTNATAVSFGGVPAASFTVLSSTIIKAKVGNGASGNVSVVTNNIAASLTGFTFLPAPVLSSFSPDTGITGGTIKIYGKYFSGATSLSFGGTSAASYKVLSDSVISAVVGSGSSGNISITTWGGSATISGFIFIPLPAISSFTPTTGTSGSVITITGTNFDNASAVYFGVTPASSFILLSPTTIQATVLGGSSGNVQVITPGGSATQSGFLFNSPPTPTITSFSPMSGAIGTVVTINGSNFSNIPANNIVYFGTVRASVISGNSTSLSVLVPAGATYQPISVTVSEVNLSAYSTSPFTVTFGGGALSLDSNSFRLPINLKGAGITGWVSLGDIDGDGKVDIITGSDSYVLSVFRNMSTQKSIFFDSRKDFPSGESFYASCVADLDGDGKLDVVTTFNSNIGEIEIFRNMSTPGNISFAPFVNYYTSTQRYPTYVAISDLDGDGKPDIIVTNSWDSSVSIFKNISTKGVISFAAPVQITVGILPNEVIATDLDGDGKADIVVVTDTSISVIRNMCTLNNLSFARYISFPAAKGSIYGTPEILSAGDIDGDGKSDIVVANNNLANLNTVSVLRNTSSIGNINFDPKIDINVVTNVNGPDPIGSSLGDLDGDGKIDLVVTNGSYGPVSIFKNTSSSGHISFLQNLNFDPHYEYAFNSAIGDIDGDGKPDIVIANQQSVVSIFRNQAGEPLSICSPIGNTMIVSDLIGTNYQWQVDTGTNFIDISNNINYAGVNAKTLQLNNIPSGWNGYQYRCIVDGKNSSSYTLAFTDLWTGNVNSSWENPANWSCGTVPDANTDVIINNGTVVVNSNVTVRSLYINPSVSFTINPPYNMTITH